MQRNILIGFAMIALACGALAMAVLGPLGADVIRWRVSENAENQILGGDLATLLFAVPVALFGGILWLRGHRLAPVLSIAPALYSVYMFTSLILGIGYDRYTGNNEAAFPLLLALVILGWTISAVSWAHISTGAPESLSAGKRRALALPLLIVGILFAMAWGQQIWQVIDDPLAVAEYRDDPATFWIIKTLDLAFVVPIAIATGIGLLTRSPLAVRVAHALVGFMALMSASVSGMGLVMLVRDDPSATVAFPIVTVAAMILFVGLAGMLYRGYVQDTNRSGLKSDRVHDYRYGNLKRLDV